jgi:hypothetical protein
VTARRACILAQRKRILESTHFYHPQLLVQIHHGHADARTRIPVPGSTKRRVADEHPPAVVQAAHFVGGEPHPSAQALHIGRAQRRLGDPVRRFDGNRLPGERETAGRIQLTSKR